VVVFRNLSSLMLWAGERHLLRRANDKLRGADEALQESLLALVVIVIGSILYAWNDLSRGLDAYAWILVHLAATVTYDLTIRHLTQWWPISMHGQQFFHCVLSSPVLLLFAYTNDELKMNSIVSFLELSAKEKMCIAGSILGGFVISTTVIKLQRLVTATSFSVVRNMNKVIIIIVNIIWIEGIPSLGNTVGLLLSLSGGMYYGLVRRRRTTRRKDKEKDL